MVKFAFLFVTALSLAACASKTPKPKYIEEKNKAKYAQTTELTEPPEEVLRAARAVLDELTRQSDPPAESTLKENDNSIFTGWVYGMAKDKYVQFDYNGSPRRKQLAVRRTYGYTVTPSLSGSQVTLSSEEEIQEVDLKTGEPKRWKHVNSDPAVYDLLLHRLREQMRAQ